MFNLNLNQSILAKKCGKNKLYLKFSLLLKQRLRIYKKVLCWRRTFLKNPALFRRRRKDKLQGFHRRKTSFFSGFFRFKKKETTQTKFFVFSGRVNFWRRFFLKLTYLLFFILLCVLIFVFFFTSFFVVKNITLERENLRVDTGKIIDSLQNYLYRNILFVSTVEIEKQIQKNFPEYQSVYVKRILPGTLMVQVKNFDIVTRVKVYIKPQNKFSELDIKTLEIKPSEQILALNSEGIIEQDSGDYENFPFLEISRVQEMPLVQGDRLLEKELLDLILQAKTLLWEVLGINAVSIFYFPDAKEVHLKTEQGYEIWVDFSSPVAEQIDKLKKISNDVDWTKNPPAEHIDLRVKNRIIYK